MPTLWVMRGLPGSGKSTRALEIQQIEQSDRSVTCLIASADKYWIRPDGTYDWNPRYLKNAHAWCYRQVEEAMENGYHVILDNTNIKRRDFAPYLDLAAIHTYQTKEVVVGKFDEESCESYAKRNVHGCSIDVIQKKAKEFEP